MSNSNNSTLSVIDEVERNDDGSLNLYRNLTSEEAVQGLRILNNVYHHITVLWVKNILTTNDMSYARYKLYLATRILIDIL